MSRGDPNDHAKVELLDLKVMVKPSAACSENQSPHRNVGNTQDAKHTIYFCTKAASKTEVPHFFGGYCLDLPSKDRLPLLVAEV